MGMVTTLVPPHSGSPGRRETMIYRFVWVELSDLKPENGR